MSAPVNIIANRMLLRDCDSDAIVRVVHRTSSHTWLCPVDDDSWPYPVPSRNILNCLQTKSGRFELELEDDWTILSIDITQKKASEERQKENWAVIEFLFSVDDVVLLLNRRTRRAIISQAKLKFGLSGSTIARILKRYWKRGMAFAAVKPDFAKCGGPGKSRNLGEKKVGAPRTISPGIGRNITEDVRRILRLICDYRLTHPGITWGRLYDRCIEMYFVIEVKDAEGRTVQKKDENAPTLRQLQYIWYKEYPWVVRHRKRVGEHRWLLQERAITGMADGDILGPGDRFILDATVADVYLVSLFDRRRIVGRPVIYFVIDLFSRLIVGIYVGFEGPSWIGAMMSLVNVVTPKVEFCKFYGVEITGDEWNAHHLPKCVLGDCSEMKSVRSGYNLTQNLRVDIDNAPVGRADFKAVVETRFRTVPAKWGPFIPGYVRKDLDKRDGPDYRLDGKFNLHEFTADVIHAVLIHNATPIQDLKPIPAMVTDGLPPCPNDLWSWGIENLSGRLRVASIDEVALNLLPPVRVRVTAKGIEFKGAYYACDTALKDGWFERARHREWNLGACHDPREMALLYIRDASLPKGFEVCHLLPSSVEYAGKTLFEVEEVQLANKRLIASGESERQLDRIGHQAKMDQIEKTAKREWRQSVDTSQSKKERLDGIKKNRRIEKRLEQDAHAIRISDSTNSEVPLPSASEKANSGIADYGDRAMDLLRNNRRVREEQK